MSGAVTVIGRGQVHQFLGASGMDGAILRFGDELLDGYSMELQRNLVATVLLWMERWYDGSRSERHVPGDADVRLHRRFTELLEQDFARHHDAGHHADALAVPRAALSRVLA